MMGQFATLRCCPLRERETGRVKNAIVQLTLNKARITFSKEFAYLNQILSLDSALGT
jgi:hypothetical protein